MTTPDRAENTGDNLRRAAELQHEAQRNAHIDVQSEGDAPQTPLPDFNT